MSHKWQKTELGELIETLKGCAFKSKDYVPKGVPVVRVSDFTENSISEDNLVYLPEALAEEYSAYKLRHDNIVIQTVGSWQYNPASVVGKVIKVPREFSSSLLNQNAVKLIPNKSIDEKFLYYRLKDDTFKAHVLGCAQGAANQASITLTTIKRFKFHVPPIDTQKKIATILSAYDDLIENNLKRIKLLEEMAQITYEEWFVRLKFPGHETAVMDLETGLPVGWEKLKLSSLVTFIFGYPFNASLFNADGNGMPIIRIRNIPDSSTTDFTTEVVDVKYIVNTGDLLVGMDGEFYINNWSSAPAYLVQRTCNIKPLHDRDLGFLREAIRTPIKFYESTISGATVAHLGKKHLDEIELIFPTNDSERLLPFFNNLLFSKLNLAKQNQLLKEARDILLPRLMTGMIDVEQLVLPEPFGNAISTTT